MKRPLTTSLSVPPPGQPQAPEPALSKVPPQPPTWRETAPIVASLIDILSAMESDPKAGPALKAYRAAMCRQGEAAAAIGGREAMEAVLRQAVEAAPDQIERERTLTEAWSELSG